MCSDFMKLDYIKSKDLKSINPNDEAQYIPLSQVYLGIAASTSIHEI